MTPACHQPIEKCIDSAKTNVLSREEENGKTYFEVESLEGETARDILYSADGKVAEIEEAVAMSVLPAAVKATVSKEYPKGKILKAKKSLVSLLQGTKFTSGSGRLNTKSLSIRRARL